MPPHEPPRLELADLSPDVNSTTGAIVDAALAVHRALGPGLLESAYSVLMVHALRKRGLRVDTEVPVPVEFEGATVPTGFRIDLLVHDRVIVELKAVDRVLPVHRAQVLTYLKLSGLPVALLINFNEALVTKGISRFVHTNDGGNAESAENAEPVPAPPPATAGSPNDWISRSRTSAGPRSSPTRVRPHPEDDAPSSGP